MTSAASLESLRQSLLVRVPPARVYHALLDPEALRLLYRAHVRLNPGVDGEFSLFDGAVEGRFTHLEANHRIAADWRMRLAGWPETHWSRLRIVLSPDPEGTRLHLEQEGIPMDCMDAVLDHWDHHTWPNLKLLLEPPMLHAHHGAVLGVRSRDRSWPFT